MDGRRLVAVVVVPVRHGMAPAGGGRRVRSVRYGDTRDLLGRGRSETAGPDPGGRTSSSKCCGWAGEWLLQQHIYHHHLPVVFFLPRGWGNRRWTAVQSSVGRLAGGAVKVAGNGDGEQARGWWWCGGEG